MKKYAGFTIVEMLIAMGIMTMLLVILTQVFGSIINLRQGSEAVSSVAQDSRYILSRLAYDIARADTISSPAIGSTSSTLILTIDGVSYIYSQDDQTLLLKIGSNPALPITSDRTQISSLNFVRANDIATQSVINLNFILSSVIPQPGSITTSRVFNTTYTTN